MIGQEARALVEGVERRLDEIDALADPVAREKATETVRALLELYGAGLERIVDEVAARDDGTIAAALAEDELVSHLLLLHGLHPVGLEDRVLGALEEVRPYLESHGGNVELIGVEGGAARLRLAGSCHGCPSSTMTLKLAIENAIRKAAPEIEEVIAEGEPAEADASGLLQIEVARDIGRPSPQLEGEWTMVGGLRELAGGGAVVKEIAGQAILFAAIGENVYAYQSRCPACASSLAGAELDQTGVACPGCGGRYDVLRAGRGLDAPALHLDPVPLLVSDQGLVKVALAVPA